MIHDENRELVAARFPHIGKVLSLLWGHPEVVTYIDKLYMDNRGGTRRGFPADITRALSAIRASHQALGRPEPPAQQSVSTPWGQGGRRGRW